MGRSERPDNNLTTSHLEGARMSIHRRTDSKASPWRVSYRDEAGKQRTKSFATHRDAVQFDALVKARLQGETVKAVSPMLAPTGPTLHDWLEEWFQNYAAQWSIRTRHQRALLCNKWIDPMLGEVPVNELTKRRIKAYRADMAAAGASNNTINSATSVLSAALTAAEEDEVIDNNPCRNMRRMPHHRKLIKPLTPLEVEAIRYAMPTPRDKIIVSLIAYAGLRPGEVCGLVAGSIRNGMIYVDQSAQFGQIVPTKTRKPRTITILPSLAADLSDYGLGADDELVVQGDKGGILNWNIWGQRVWRAHVPDMSVTPYHLRHTFASLALHEGRSLPWIASEMGHASPTTLLDHYAHLYHEAELATSIPMDVAIRDARSEESQQARAWQASQRAEA
jgi:integrase